MIVFGAWVVAAAVSAVAVPLVRRLALRWRVVDNPAVEAERRMHNQPVPLLGGLAVWFAVTVLVLAGTTIWPVLTGTFIRASQLWGVLLGATVLMIGGWLDDRYGLRPRWQILFPLLAATIAFISGIGVNFLTNPLGGVVRIDQLRLPVSLGDWQYVFNVGSFVVALVWLMGMMYTTKVLDGLDGLVSGVTAIGAAIIVFLSLRPPVLQPETAILAAIVGGAFVGFLPFNWSPAKIFLGEGGSVLAGFLLGVLAIIAGGKIATMLLVIGIPALDVVWVLGRRLVTSGKIALADAGHLHHRLVRAGLSVPAAVSFFYVVTASFGLVAIFLQSRGKLVALAILAIFMVGLASVLVSRGERA